MKTCKIISSLVFCSFTKNQKISFYWKTSWLYFLVLKCPALSSAFILEVCHAQLKPPWLQKRSQQVSSKHSCLKEVLSLTQGSRTNTAMNLLLSLRSLSFCVCFKAGVVLGGEHRPAPPQNPSGLHRPGPAGQEEPDRGRQRINC